jgi:hypothetical protein
MSIIFATGPKVNKLSRADALAAAKKNPDFPKNATDLTVEELDGHWVAAIHVADGNPFGQPADSSEEGPGPKSEGPDDTAPGPDDGPPKDDGDEGPPSDDGSDGPPKDGDEHGEKGGEKHELHAIMDGIQKLLIALGVPDENPEEGPVPGEEQSSGPPGPPGAGGPPGGPEAPPPPHEKPLKPGEVPPGGTPVGSPAFAHISPHPWEGLIGVAATFEVEERVPNEFTSSDVNDELDELAKGTGFKVKQVQTHVNEQGHRIAKALISAY